MEEQKQSSPKLLKKGLNMSSPTLNKEKHYLPSRFALDPTKKDSNLQTLLNSIEFNTKEESRLKLSSPIQTSHKDRPKLQLNKRQQPSEFKPKPMKRQESDMQNFKQIFLDPRHQVLSKIQQQSKSQEVVMAKQMCKDYQKLLQFQKGNHSSSPGKDRDEPLQQADVKKHFQEVIQLLEKPQLKSSLSSFYQEQIRIEPPETPNSSIASTISPGSGYAPSVPLLPSKKGTLKELLMRAKAGMNTEDIQKEAHIAFYLGMAYEENRSFRSAIRFYKRFLGFAKAMEDKIGMALGANRVAVNLFYKGQTLKSISFHHENLKLSDTDNCFAAYYNLGVSHRTIQQYEKAISCLETALQWSRQRGQAESQCITLGQLAVTYKSMEQYQRSLQQFQKSADICRRLKKTSLLAENLQEMLLITSHYNLSSVQRILQIAEQAYDCSKILQLKTSQEQQACNIGLIRGFEEFEKSVGDYVTVPEIEECQLEMEERGESHGNCHEEDKIREV